MASRLQQPLFCPKLVCGQWALLPEQETFINQYAQNWNANVLSCETIDENEVETYLRQAYVGVGLEPPSIRWFDSPLEFVFACGEQFIGASEAYDMLTSQWRTLEKLWDSALGRIQACFQEDLIETTREYFQQSVLSRISQRLRDSIKNSVWENRSSDSRWQRWNFDMSKDIDDCVQDSMNAYEDAPTLSWISLFGILFEENALMDFALFNENVSGYRLGASTAWVVRKPVQLIYTRPGSQQHEESIYVQYRNGWACSIQCAEDEDKIS